MGFCCQSHAARNKKTFANLSISDTDSSKSGLKKPMSSSYNSMTASFNT